MSETPRAAEFPSTIGQYTYLILTHFGRRWLSVTGHKEPRMTFLYQ